MVSKEEFDELNAKLAVYEKQQKEIMDHMKVEVNQEVQKVAGDLRTLYTQVSEAMNTLVKRVDKLENVMNNQAKVKKSLINPKHILPDKLTKTDEWKQWKSDVEDYCQEHFDGMKELLEKVRKIETEITEEYFEFEAGDWWSKGEMLWRFLKKYTGGEARKVVTGVRKDNGWEAWRKLHLQFEPGLVMREAQVMSQFTGMVNRSAKNPAETRMLMVELEEKAKRVEEITQGTEWRRGTK